RPIADWRLAFGAVAEEIRSANDAIRALRLKQRDLDLEIKQVEAALQANPSRKMEVRIDLAANASARATFRVSYTVRGARWAPLYDARLDTGSRERKPALELVRRAEIVQQTGEDWRDVALSVSTVRTAKGGNAPELKPLIVRYYAAGPHQDRLTSVPMSAPPGYAPSGYAPDIAASKRVDQPGGSAQLQGAVKALRETEAVMETGGYQVVFRVPGRISVGA